jgi:hypothetical protein
MTWISRGLLKERIDNAVDETDLEPLVDIRSTEHSDDFCNCLHNHLLVWLGFIFQVIDNSSNDLAAQSGGQSRACHDLILRHIALRKGRSEGIPSMEAIMEKA